VACEHNAELNAEYDALPGSLPVGNHGVMSMSSATRSHSTAGVRRVPTSVWAGASCLLVLTVFAQAVLAGQGLFGSAGFLVHGYIGNASFVLGLVAALAVAAARLPGRLVGLSGLVLLVLSTQTGLGYVGRNVPEAAAWHVPLGVLTFSLVTLQAVAAVLAVGGKGSSSAADRA
jgi:hypothetical protein